MYFNEKEQALNELLYEIEYIDELLSNKDKNNGINLENIQQGSYYLLIKSNDNKYYSLKNKTNNSNMEYSIATENNKIINIKILWNTSDLLPNMEIKIN